VTKWTCTLPNRLLLNISLCFYSNLIYLSATQRLQLPYVHEFCPLRTLILKRPGTNYGMYFLLSWFLPFTCIRLQDYFGFWGTSGHSVSLLFVKYHSSLQFTLLFADILSTENQIIYNCIKVALFSFFIFLSLIVWNFSFSVALRL
jgi:hypothetical protein